jgi:hypothetical protein
MPPASPHRAGTTESDPTLDAEREHLRDSREFLRLMRDNVLSLRALAGDPVSEEYLKADLYRRAEALKDLPDAPLFFGRLEFHEPVWAADFAGAPRGAPGGRPPG